MGDQSAPPRCQARSRPLPGVSQRVLNGREMRRAGLDLACDFFPLFALAIRHFGRRHDDLHARAGGQLQWLTGYENTPVEFRLDEWHSLPPYELKPSFDITTRLYQLASRRMRQLKAITSPASAV